MLLVVLLVAYLAEVLFLLHAVETCKLDAVIVIIGVVHAHFSILTIRLFLLFLNNTSVLLCMNLKFLFSKGLLLVLGHSLLTGVFGILESRLDINLVDAKEDRGLVLVVTGYLVDRRLNKLQLATQLFIFEVLQKIL